MSSSDVREAIRAITQRAGEMAAEAQRDPALKARLDAMVAEAIEAEKTERRHSVERTWRERGIPERLFSMLHDSAHEGDPGPLAPKPTKALEAVGRFLRPTESKTILIVAGANGVGKTLAAAWGCAFHGGRLVKAVDLIRAGMFPDDADFWPTLERVRLLAIDDLGFEVLDAKGYGLGCILDLLDRRYDAARKTIITVNVPLEQFRERYATGVGFRLWDRLREVGRFVELAGKSMRGGDAS